MGRLKLFVKVNSYDNATKDDFCRVWLTESVAKDLDVKPIEDWVYLSKDWMGVLSTQAMVAGISEGKGYEVFATEDRMEDAHFKNGDRIKVWKLTEWE